MFKANHTKDVGNIVELILKDIYDINSEDSLNKL
jgi:hypothetical protein